MWERACSRMRCASRHNQSLTRRIREQARSHKGFLVSGKSRAHKNARHNRASCIDLINGRGK